MISPSSDSFVFCEEVDNFGDGTGDTCSLRATCNDCEGELADFNSSSSSFVNSPPLDEFELSTIEIGELFLELDKLILV